MSGWCSLMACSSSRAYRSIRSCVILLPPEQSLPPRPVLCALLRAPDRCLRLYPPRLPITMSPASICPARSSISSAALPSTRWVGRVATPGLIGGQVAVLRLHVWSLPHATIESYPRGGPADTPNELDLDLFGKLRRARGCPGPSP